MSTDKLAKTTEITALSIQPDQLADIREAIREMGPSSLSAFDLARIKVPAAGATTWELPGGDPVKAIDAVIIAAQTARQYYAQAAGDEGAVSGAPPDCASADGLTGHGAPGGNCADCPLGKFGGGCKERRHLLLLIEGSTLPVFLNLPPASIKNLRNYQFQELIGRQNGLVPRKVVTRIGLAADKNGQGQPFSRATFELVSVLAPQQQAVAAQYAESMAGLLSALAFAPEAPVPVSDLSVDDYTE